MSFRTLVWNALEDLHLVDNFSGTSLGIIKEIQGYSGILEKEFIDSKKTNKGEFIVWAIKRDFRE